MNFNNLLAAFLLVASSSSFSDAASVRDNSEKSKNFLRRELASRKLKAKSNKGGGGPGSVPTPAPPTFAPIKTVTSMEDWNNGCPSESNKVKDCVIVGGPSSTLNCKSCLKSLSFTSNPVASSPGVEKCAESVTCNGCSAEDIRPFFACGLKVDDVFDGVTPATPAPVPVPVVPVTPPPAVPTAPPTDAVTIDEINCPAVWPGSGTMCVMLDGFTFKRCAYPENGPDAVCGCSKYQPIWSCVGKTNEFPSATGALVTTDLFQNGNAGIFGGMFVGAAVCYFAVMALQNYQRRKDYQKVPVASETASLITN